MPTGALPGARHSRHASANSVVSPTSPSTAFLYTEKADDGLVRICSPRLAAFTSSILGVQIFWSILMAHGTPYLRSLGFSPALTSLVWMAGPLGGVFVQPIVGVWSDRYRPKPGSIFEKAGRRKPFIVLGAAGVAVLILCLANVREGFEFLGLVAGVSQTRLESAIGQEGHGSALLVVVAMLWVYLLNIAIQPVQAGVRAFVVDNVLPHQQDEANAWLGRWNCFGAVFTFWLGSMDLPRIVPLLGKTQFKALSIIEVVMLLLTIPISFTADPGLERNEISDMEDKVSVKEIWLSLYRTYKLIPRTTWTVFRVQFWSWMAFFPFLYYSSLYVGSLSTGNISTIGSMTNATQSTAELHKTMQNAIKTVSEDITPRSHYPPSMGSSPDEIIAQTGSFASFLFALMSLVFTFVLPFLTSQVRSITPQRLWFASHLLFALVMMLTFFVKTVAAGTALMACLGFSWAVTQWVPFALISAEVSRSEATARADRESGWDRDASQQMAGAGAVFGLHNIAIAGPQVIAAIECAALFKLFDILGVHDSIGNVLRWSALAALGAAIVCRHLLG